jgi:hypothetical protein
MVCLYRSPISVGRMGIFFSFKLCLPAFAAIRGGGRVSTLWPRTTKCYETSYVRRSKREMLLLPWPKNRRQERFFYYSALNECQQMKMECLGRMLRWKFHCGIQLEFLNVQGDLESIPKNRFVQPTCSRRAGTTNRVIVPARQCWNF